MVFDKRKYKKFKNNVENFIDVMPIDEDKKNFIENKLMGEAYNELDELILESRPPRLLIFGRSGAGKSSLINALAGKNVSKVGNVEPTTLESKQYQISFPEHNCSWDVVDSRGLFESMSPDGGIPEDTKKLIKQDITEYRPDILIHIMTPDQVRAGEKDFEVVNQLKKDIGSSFPPIIYGINKVDSYISPGDNWPPEDNAELSGNIKKNLDFVANLLNESEDKIPMKNNNPLYGYKFKSDNHISAIPLYLKDEPYWNLNTLKRCIGKDLPDDARLQFARSKQEEELLRDVSKDFTNRFSKIAASAAIFPNSTFVITPLQLFLIGIIGALSGEELNKETIHKYLSAMGVSAVGGLAAREMARAAIDYVPWAGQTISPAIAAGTTWSIGRSAEKYFFDNKKVDSNEFKDKGIDKFENIDEEIDID